MLEIPDLETGYVLSAKKKNTKWGGSQTLQKVERDSYEQSYWCKVITEFLQRNVDFHYEIQF